MYDLETFVSFELAEWSYNVSSSTKKENIHNNQKDVILN